MSYFGEGRTVITSSKSRTVPQRRKTVFGQREARNIVKAIKASHLIPAAKKYLLTTFPERLSAQDVQFVNWLTDSPFVLSKFTFEDWLKRTSNRYEARNDPERNALIAIRNALGALREEPTLFRGDPLADFTYDHPVLALAVTEFRDCLQSFGFSMRGVGRQNFEAFRWVLTAVDAVSSTAKKSLDTLRQCIPIKPIILQKSVTRIAVVGDAGFNNSAQQFVLKKISDIHQQAPFDLLVHLGDTYYSGKDGEFLRNLLGPFASLNMTKIAVCGNHDLYRGGAGFQDVLKVWGQEGRYLAIETPDWVVACLDTSLDAADIGRMNGHLDDGQFKWLKQLISRLDDKKLVLMTHHYPISAWDKSQPTIAAQLKPLFGNFFSWYWGHEHGCAAYPPGIDGYYGACVGNGSFREPWSPPTVPAQSIDWYAKARCVHFSKKGLAWRPPFLQQVHFWAHGFLELELKKGAIDESYHVEGEPIYTRHL
jgi:predicted phosphodiesterase